MKLKTVLCLFLVLLLISGCGRKEAEPVPTPNQTPDQATVIEPLPETTPEPTPQPTPEPERFYLEGYDATTVGDYFCEVVLSAEYSHGGGESSRLQKWAGPIYYTVYGNATVEDLLQIQALAEGLNEIKGFPGMYPAENSGQENFTIKFLDSQTMNDEAGYVVYGEQADGICYWDYYIDTNDLYNVRIWVRDDIDQQLRNSVILEEIVNSLGMGNDTNMRTDSIIYQGYSETQELSDMDWLLLRLLYNEKMLRGMNESECRAVINEIYK